MNRPKTTAEIITDSLAIGILDLTIDKETNLQPINEEEVE
jgi:hypothetical protein